MKRYAWLLCGLTAVLLIASGCNTRGVETPSNPAPPPTEPPTSVAPPTPPPIPPK